MSQEIFTFLADVVSQKEPASEEQKRQAQEFGFVAANVPPEIREERDKIVSEIAWVLNASADEKKKSYPAKKYRLYLATPRDQLDPNMWLREVKQAGERESLLSSVLPTFDRFVQAYQIEFNRELYREILGVDQQWSLLEKQLETANQAADAVQKINAFVKKYAKAFNAMDYQRLFEICQGKKQAQKGFAWLLKVGPFNQNGGLFLRFPSETLQKFRGLLEEAPPPPSPQPQRKDRFDELKEKFASLVSQRGHQKISEENEGEEEAKARERRANILWTSIELAREGLKAQSKAFVPQLQETAVLSDIEKNILGCLFLMHPSRKDEKWQEKFTKCSKGFLSSQPKDLEEIEYVETIVDLMVAHIDRHTPHSARYEVLQAFKERLLAIRNELEAKSLYGFWMGLPEAVEAGGRDVLPEGAETGDGSSTEAEKSAAEDVFVKSEALIQFIIQKISSIRRKEKKGKNDKQEREKFGTLLSALGTHFTAFAEMREGQNFLAYTLKEIRKLSSEIRKNMTRQSYEKSFPKLDAFLKKWEGRFNLLPPLR